MLRFLIAALILVPVLELYLLVVIGRHIGLVPMLFLLVSSALVGGVVARWKARQVFDGWREAVARGRMPEEGLLSGALVLLGGALLIAPGILTDLAGVLLMLPPVRRFVSKHARRSLERRMRDGSLRVTQVRVGVSTDFEGDGPTSFPGERPTSFPRSESSHRGASGEVDAEFTTDDEPRG
ncbi:FxsA family protein [Corallococcus sp. H22C18031201]|nr:FxsA family protein [Corallococcus sp. H22C18031201]